MSTVCNVCLCKKAECHVCVFCGGEYPTLEHVIAHQKKRKHYGAHFVLDVKDRRGYEPALESDRRGRVRRAVTRESPTVSGNVVLLDAGHVLQGGLEDLAIVAVDNPDVEDDFPLDEEEDLIDEAELFGSADEEQDSTDSVVDVLDRSKRPRAEEPAVSGPRLSRIRVGEGDQGGLERTTVPTSDADSTLNTKDPPSWALTTLERFPDVTFSEDYSKFFCPCMPSRARSTSFKSGNISNHRKSSSCSAVGVLSQVNKPIISTIGYHKALLNLVVGCNLSLNALDSIELRTFANYGRDAKTRSILTIPSRRAFMRDLLEVEYERLQDKLVTVLSHAASRVSITFDLWTDRATRSFVCVTAHFFDKDWRLRAPLLGLIDIPKNKENANAERLARDIAHVLGGMLGNRWREKVFCSVTDGAGNVVNASRALAVSRSCFQHGLQNFLKGFCTHESNVATALSAANYLAALTGKSTKYRELFGRIPSGSSTRFNSQISAAKAIVDASSAIITAARVPLHEQAPGLSPIVNHLTQPRPGQQHLGLDVLHDLVLVLGPMMEITIEQEGELYITSSGVIPKLLKADAQLEACLAVARNPPADGSPADVPKVGGHDGEVYGTLRCPHEVARWHGRINFFWNKYIAHFMDDELFLCATVLDPRFGLRSLDRIAQRAAVSALKKRLGDRYDSQHADGDVAAPVHEDAMFLADVGRLLEEEGIGAGDERDVQNQAYDARKHAAVSAEIRALSTALLGPQDSPLEFYRRNPHLVLARAEALDVLSVPAGEAPSERIFSVASRIMTAIRTKMSVATLKMLTFVKKNTKALNQVFF